jgi:hypothetical protein
MKHSVNVILTNIVAYMSAENAIKAIAAIGTLIYVLNQIEEFRKNIKDNHEGSFKKYIRSFYS